MKWNQIVYSLISLLLLTSCMKKEEPFFFEGLTLSEMQGEWIINKRVKGDYPNKIHINLSPCDSQEVLIINPDGESIHRVYTNMSEPCQYTDYAIKFIDSSNYFKSIEKIDLSNDKKYIGCDIYASSISLKYFPTPDSLNKTLDSFKRK